MSDNLYGASTRLARGRGPRTLPRAITRSANAEGIARTLVAIFPDSGRRAPPLFVLDLNATGMPLHGHQKGRFSQGLYDWDAILPRFEICGRELLAVS